jgi:hypothetical protein
MGLILGIALLLVTLCVCGWVAFTDAMGNTPHRVSFWVILICGVALSALMIIAHTMGWGW